jgi:hypothetical protein
MPLREKFAALIRTVVPALYGVGISWLVSRFPAVQDALDWLNETVGADVSAAIGLAVTALVIGGYYWLARKLGARFPALEKWLLGSSLVPIYTASTIYIVGKDTGIIDDTRGINE